MAHLAHEDSTASLTGSVTEADIKRGEDVKACLNVRVYPPSELVRRDARGAARRRAQLRVRSQPALTAPHRAASCAPPCRSLMSEPSYEDEPDVSINIHQKKDGGYGITCTQKERGSIIASIVTVVEPGSEAEKAGVLIGDRLISVRDLDGKLPLHSPGVAIVMTQENFSPTLAWVRLAKHCQFCFLAQSQAFS